MNEFSKEAPKHTHFPPRILIWIYADDFSVGKSKIIFFADDNFSIAAIGHKKAPDRFVTVKKSVFEIGGAMHKPNDQYSPWSTLEVIIIFNDDEVLLFRCESLVVSSGLQVLQVVFKNSEEFNN